MTPEQSAGFILNGPTLTAVIAVITGLIGTVTFLYKAVSSAKDAETKVQRERIAALEKDIAEMRINQDRRLADMRAEYERREAIMQRQIEKWEALTLNGILPGVDSIASTMRDANVQRRLR